MCSAKIEESTYEIMKHESCTKQKYKNLCVQMKLVIYRKYMIIAIFDKDLCRIFTFTSLLYLYGREPRIYYYIILGISYLNFIYYKIRKPFRIHL